MIPPKLFCLKLFSAVSFFYTPWGPHMYIPARYKAAQKIRLLLDEGTFQTVEAVKAVEAKLDELIPKASCTR